MAAGGKARRLAWRVLIGLALALAVLAVLTHLYGERLLRDQVLARLSAASMLTPRLDAPISWRMHPEPTLTLNALSLIDASGLTRLRIDALTVVLDKEALYSRRLHLREVSLSGLSLSLASDEPGHWRPDGWLRPGPDASTTRSPPIDSVRIDEGELRITGERALALSGFALSAGPFSPGVSGGFEIAFELSAERPAALAAQVTIKGGFISPGEHIALSDTVISVKGGGHALGEASLDGAFDALFLQEDGTIGLEGLAISLDASNPRAQIASRLALQQLNGRGGRWRGEGGTLEADWEESDQSFSAHLAADELNWDDKVLSFPAFVASLVSTTPDVRLDGEGALALLATPERMVLDLTLDTLHSRVPHPGTPDQPLRISAAGRLGIEVDPGDFSTVIAEGALQGGFEQTRFDGDWQFDAGRLPPLDIRLNLDAIDLDAYRPPGDPRPSADRGPTDLAFWRDWPVSGTLRIGELELQGLVTRDAVLRLGADD